MRLGRVIDNTFRAGEKVELVDFEEKRMQFLYKDDRYHFMDLETYDQISLSADEVGEARDFLKENTEVEILFIDGSPVTVELPNFIELRIAKTDPGIRGDTASGGSKPATLETGAVDPGAALPQRGRRGEGGHAERRVPRPRGDGGLGGIGQAKRPRRGPAERPRALTPERRRRAGGPPQPRRARDRARRRPHSRGAEPRARRDGAGAAARRLRRDRSDGGAGPRRAARRRTSSRSRRRWSERSIARPPPTPRRSCRGRRRQGGAGRSASSRR